MSHTIINIDSSSPHHNSITLPRLINIIPFRPRDAELQLETLLLFLILLFDLRHIPNHLALPHSK